MTTRRILRFAQVSNVTGLKHSAIYERISAGTFPRPVPLGPKARGWLENEVNDWIAERIAERDSETAVTCNTENTAA